MRKEKIVKNRNQLTNKYEIAEFDRQLKTKARFIENAYKKQITLIREGNKRMEGSGAAHGLQDPELKRKPRYQTTQKNVQHMSTPQKPKPGAKTYQKVSPIKIAEAESRASSLRSQRQEQDTRRKLGMESSQEREQKDEEIDKQYNETFTSVLGKERFEESRYSRSRNHTVNTPQSSAYSNRQGSLK